MKRWTIVEHEDNLQQLIDDFQNGYLTRRGFFAKAAAFGLTAAAAVGMLGTPRTQRTAAAQDSPPEVNPKQWEQGKGWGWSGETTTSSATSTSSALN